MTENELLRAYGLPPETLTPSQTPAYSTDVLEWPDGRDDPPPGPPSLPVVVRRRHKGRWVWWRRRDGRGRYITRPIAGYGVDR